MQVRAREMDARTSLVWQIGELRGRHGGACCWMRICYEESEAARGEVLRNISSAWGRVMGFLVDQLPGFWSREAVEHVCIWLVSSGEASICANLIGRGTDCLA